jgi:MoaA/NifB/PqqE/SkfB family radical SAM enzyme
MMTLLNYRNYGRLWRVYGRSVVEYGTLRKIINALRTEWAYRRRRSRMSSVPYLLYLEPLYYCNLACPLCDRQAFPEARTGRAGRLSMDILDKLLDEVGDYLFQCQIFGLGEPTLDWPLTQRIVEKCHSRRLFTLVSTNCTLITSAMADHIVQSPLDYLVCAIDGVSQLAYEKYRMKGRVEDAMNGLRHILDSRRRLRSRLTVEWQFLVHRHNEHEVEEARRIAQELGVFIRFSPLRGWEDEPDLREYWLPENSLRSAEQESGPTKDGYDPWPCAWLWRALVLNSNAQLARCQGYQNVSEYGSLHDSGVLQLYNGPSTVRARQLFDPRPLDDQSPFPAPCATCAFYPRHHGGAPATKAAAAGVMSRAREATFQSPGPVPPRRYVSPTGETITQSGS